MGIKIAVILVGCLTAVGCLAWVRIKYDILIDELKRDIGWQTMWHERIMDERNEPE